MSYTTGELVACPTLQSQLNDHFETCDPQFIGEPMPHFEFVMSAPNRGPLEQLVSPGNGKTRTVQLKYRQRISESDVSANQTNPTCVATTFRGDRWIDYSIDTTQNQQVESKIPISELIESCTDNGMYWQETMQMMVNALERKVATQTAVEAVALNGRWGSLVDGVNGSDQLEVRTLRSGSTDELYPYAMEEIDMALRQSGYCNAPVVFGGSTLWKYARRMEKGCCSETGVDLGAIFAEYNKAFLYDYRIAEQLGGNAYNLAVMAGATQMITWNLFQGTRGLNTILTETYSQQVIFSPRTGLPIDVMMKVDCGTLHIVMTATTKLVGLPNDLFPVDDIYQNVNFVNEIKVVNS